jgi:hypothetical protein
LLLLLMLLQGASLAALLLLGCEVKWHGTTQCTYQLQTHQLCMASFTLHVMQQHVC